MGLQPYIDRMKNWKKALIPPSIKIIDAIRLIDKNAFKTLIVVDSNNCLIGSLTDGDIRRGILKDISLEASVKEVINTSPISLSEDAHLDKIQKEMLEKRLNHVPLLDSKNKVVKIISKEDLKNRSHKENAVVLMAGGLGTRLQPLTENCPKPLLKVGDKPILETIIEGLKSHGFSELFITVNYMSDKIENYFQGGAAWGVNIRYIKESKSLGTAGALSLLPKENINAPFLIINGDLLTKTNYDQLLTFHQERAASATMAVREYDFQIPYGVLEINDQKIISINEKPVHKFFVNAGIYVLSPSVLEMIPKEEYFEMTQLFQKIVNEKQLAAPFPLREYWLDIGKMSDFLKAKEEFEKIFS